MADETTVERNVILTPRRASTPSVAFVVSSEPGLESVTITVHGLSGDEVMPIQILGADWANATTLHPLTAEEMPVQCTPGANTISIVAEGIYRVNLPQTTSLADVTIYRNTVVPVV